MLKSFFRDYARKPKFWEHPLVYCFLTAGFSSLDWWSFRMLFAATGEIASPLIINVFSIACAASVDIGIPWVISSHISTKKVAKRFSLILLALWVIILGFIIYLLIMSGGSTADLGWDSLTASVSAEASSPIRWVFITLPMLTTSVLTQYSIAREEFVLMHDAEVIRQDIIELDTYIKALRDYLQDEEKNRANRKGSIRNQFVRNVESLRLEVQSRKKKIRKRLLLSSSLDMCGKKAVKELQPTPEPQPEPLPDYGSFLDLLETPQQTLGQKECRSIAGDSVVNVSEKKAVIPADVVDDALTIRDGESDN